MGCMCAQTRPWFILSSKRVLGNGVRTHVNSNGKIPSTGGSEEGRTPDAASRRTASPTHYWLSYSDPTQILQRCTFLSVSGHRSVKTSEVRLRWSSVDLWSDSSVAHVDACPITFMDAVEIGIVLYTSSSLILEWVRWGLGNFCWWLYFLLILFSFIFI